MKKKKFLALLLTGAMALAAHRRRPMSWVWS